MGQKYKHSTKNTVDILLRKCTKYVCSAVDIAQCNMYLCISLHTLVTIILKSREMYFIIYYQLFFHSGYTLYPSCQVSKRILWLGKALLAYRDHLGLACSQIQVMTRIKLFK